ncbi:MAG: hypothetical protein KDD53_01950 [Bdellovibrionales bacterium]|nr:hypothetical protein [Bdellovibrionales bacterium]
MTALRKVIDDSKIVDARNSSDTIRLWESHREQALLWRALALIQIPLTAATIVFCIILWTTRSITLNVPHKPLPGIYTADQIPESEFIDYATRYINLIATYQPATAERQFKEARKLLLEPMLSKFDAEMMRTELQAIIDTKRTQVYFVDPTTIEVSIDGRTAYVALQGERLKMIGGRKMPIAKTSFLLQMTTVPHNSFNEYGIVITNVNYKNEVD